MPRRPRHLTFPPSRSSLSLPPSPSGSIPRTPLTPPLRLHQRHLIPSPPLSPQFLATAPSKPHPWIWRCHICTRSYNLGVTRRCLEDGHYFCSLPSPPPTPIGKRTKASARKSTRGCRAEFDYTGWSNYNIWRREVRRIQAERRGYMSNSSSKTRWEKEMDVSIPLTPRWKERNCWVDCSFPSECHNYRAQILASKLAARRRGSAEERAKLAAEEAAKEEELFRALYAQKEDDEKELTEEELRSLYLNMVVKAPTNRDIQIKDCDGLGEEGYRLEYTKSKRRKSIEALVLGWDEGTEAPPSPLKGECGWDDFGEREGEIWSEREGGKGEGEFEDVDLYESDDEGPRGRSREVVGERVVGEREKEIDEDEQMKEALRARSMFLRRFDGGETFGDEDDEIT